MKWLLKILKPIVIWISHKHFPWTHKKITGDHYYKWRDKITPGCVILSSTNGELSNLINPSDIKHGALYTGGDKIKYVHEALGRGVVKNNLVTHLTTKDRVVVLKPKFGSEEQLNAVCEAAKSYEGTKYDYMFEVGDKAFYCFELVIRSYNDIFGGMIFKSVEIIKGKRIYDYSTFLDDPERWEIIVNSEG